MLPKCTRFGRVTFKSAARTTISGSKGSKARGRARAIAMRSSVRRGALSSREADRDAAGLLTDGCTRRIAVKKLRYDWTSARAQRIARYGGRTLKEAQTCSDACKTRSDDCECRGSGSKAPNLRCRKI